jgi:hypothetical protein
MEIYTLKRMNGLFSLMFSSSIFYFISFSVVFSLPQNKLLFTVENNGLDAGCLQRIVSIHSTSNANNFPCTEI